MSPPAEALPPSLAARFRPVRELGAGNFGRVLLVEDLAGTPLALKLLSEAFPSPEALARFRHEAEVTARLAHPHIVPVVEAGAGPDAPAYIAYAYVEGSTLAALQAEAEADALHPGAVAAWGLRLAEALHAAHQEGVVHRDVKPANVLLDGRDLRPLLCDFGLAHSLEARGYRTATGVILGTPEYLAPELWRGEAATAASDQYALAATLYELRCGAPALGTREVAGLVRAAADGQRPHLPAVAHPLDPVLLRGLDPQPGGRFPDMAVFARALGEALTTAEGSSTPRFPWAAASPPQGDEAPAPSLASRRSLFVPRPPLGPARRAAAGPPGARGPGLGATVAATDLAPGHTVQAASPEAGGQPPARRAGVAPATRAAGSLAGDGGEAPPSRRPLVVASLVALALGLGLAAFRGRPPAATTPGPSAAGADPAEGLAEPPPLEDPSPEQVALEKAWARWTRDNPVHSRDDLRGATAADLETRARFISDPTFPLKVRRVLDALVAWVESRPPGPEPTPADHQLARRVFLKGLAQDLNHVRNSARKVGYSVADLGASFGAVAQAGLEMHVRTKEVREAIPELVRRLDARPDDLLAATIAAELSSAYSLEQDTARVDALAAAAARNPHAHWTLDVWGVALEAYSRASHRGLGPDCPTATRVASDATRFLDTHPTRGQSRRPLLRGEALAVRMDLLGRCSPPGDPERLVADFSAQLDALAGDCRAFPTKDRGCVLEVFLRKFREQVLAPSWRGPAELRTWILDQDP